MAKTIHTLQGNYDQINEQIDAIIEGDKGAEKKKKYGLWAIFGSIALGVTVSIAAPKGAGAAVIPLGIVFLVGLAYFIKGDAGDIDDERYHALRRVHRMLSGDCHDEASYYYTVDFRPLTHKGFCARSDRNWGLSVSDYVAPVLFGQVRLRDGTALSFNVDWFTREKKRTKTNARGKVKTKVKKKHKARYIVRVKLPEGKRAPLQSSSTAEVRRMSIGRGAPPRYKSDGSRVSTMALKRNCDNGFCVDGLLELMTWTFRQIHMESSRAAS